LTDWDTLSCNNTHTLAVKTDGTLWAWGSNSFGFLGDGTTIDRLSPVQIGSLTDWSKVATNSQGASMAIKTDGTLWSWGYNTTYGELGLGDKTNRSSPVQVGALTDWADVKGSYDCFWAIKTDGTLWAWGRNQFGQLGLGDIVDRSSPVQVGSSTSWVSMAENAGGTSFFGFK